MSASLPTTAGTEAPSQTLVKWNSAGGVSINGGATVSLATIPTGKILYITDVHVSTDSATPFLVQLKDGSSVILEAYVSSTAPLELAGIETQPTCAGGDILSLVFPAVAGKNASYFLSGWEQ